MKPFRPIVVSIKNFSVRAGFFFQTRVWGKLFYPAPKAPDFVGVFDTGNPGILDLRREEKKLSGVYKKLSGPRELG